jgi:hypothetical protein
MKKAKKVKWGLIFVVGVVVLVGCILTSGAFRYLSVCDRCGAIRQTTEWQIPRTRFAFFSHSSIRQTAVSLCLTTNRIVPTHGHKWVFAQGGGNGIKCALGRAHLVRSTVESLEVAQILETLERYHERNFRDRVLKNLFNDSTTYMVRTLFVPSGGFTNAAHLHAWVFEQNRSFNEMVTPFEDQ